MADESKSPGREDTSSGLSRREIMKRGLAIGSVGYVAPMILGSATPASAQISGSGCSTATTDCEDFVLCGTNQLGDECACAPTAEQTIACIQTGEAVNEEPACCETTADCDEGWFCIDFTNTQNCVESNPCDGPFSFCFPPCGTLPPPP